MKLKRSRLPLHKLDSGDPCSTTYGKFLNIFFKSFDLYIIYIFSLSFMLFLLYTILHYIIYIFLSSWFPWNLSLHYFSYSHVLGIFSSRSCLLSIDYLRSKLGRQIYGNPFNKNLTRIWTEGQNFRKPLLENRQTRLSKKSKFKENH